MYDPFCGNSVLATISALADFSHSKAMADLVTAGKYKGELLVTLGKVGRPATPTSSAVTRTIKMRRSGKRWPPRSGSSTTRRSRFPS